MNTPRVVITSYPLLTLLPCCHPLTLRMYALSSSYHDNINNSQHHILANLVGLTARLASLGESLGVNGRSKLTVDPNPPNADVRNTSEGCLPIDDADGGLELLMLSTLASVLIAVIFDFRLLRLDLLT